MVAMAVEPFDWRNSELMTSIENQSIMIDHESMTDVETKFGSALACEPCIAVWAENGALWHLIQSEPRPFGAELGQSEEATPRHRSFLSSPKLLKFFSEI